VRVAEWLLAVRRGREYFIGSNEFPWFRHAPVIQPWNFSTAIIFIGQE
jgi:hypothetical protein